MENNYLMLRYTINDETISNLSAASRTIDQNLNKDEKVPELGTFFLQQKASSDYVEDKALFQKKSVLPIPDALIEQYRALQYTSFMGLFPEIHRAWMTIDNQLYLWNYKEMSDFTVYDSLDQVIVSAALISPRPGVFVENVKYLIAAATPVEVVLLALSFAGNNVENDLEIMPTGLSVPSDNVNMLKIVGMKNGRIFMCGKDGSLYELEYQAEDRWFQKKCRKVNHSSKVLGYLMPSFLKFTQEDPIIDIAIDESRNILYTLSDKKSVIQVYDLGDKGDMIAKVAEKSNIIEEAQYLCPRGVKSFKIVSLTPITTTESSRVTLMAVTSTGIRLYFSSYPNSYTTTGRPSVLDLLHVRLPPTSGPVDRPYDSYSDVHSCYYAQGTFLLADSRNEEVDTLIGGSPDWNQKSMNTNLVEKSTSNEVHGKVWALDEESPLDDWLLDPKVLRNELAIQHLVPKRRFLALTGNGLFTLEKMRPVDYLSELLLTSGGRDTDEILAFFQKYGEDQACAMCLMLACSSPHVVNAIKALSPSGSRGAPQSVITSDVNATMWATRMFFKLGGRPFFPQLPPGTPTLTGDFGYAVASPEPIYSNSHNGFCLYMSRILRPIWTQAITKKQIQRSFLTNQDVQIQICSFTRQQLSDMVNWLSSLKEFLIKHPQFSSGPQAATQKMELMSTTKRKFDEEARKFEQRSLANMQILLQRAIEACSFLEILNEGDHFGKMIEKLSPNVQVQLSQTTFREFVTSGLGVQLAKELVNALINLYTNESRPVDLLTARLRERSPGFFSDVDRMLFEGRQLIQQAKLCIDTADRFKTLEVALDKYLMKIAGNLPLQLIAQEFQQLRFYTGVVKLALEHAKALDPAGLAVKWNNNGRPMEDLMGRKAFESRMECYNTIISVFDELLQLQPTSGPDLSRVDPERLDRLKLQTLQTAMESNDELFHHCLYQWYLDRGLATELLQLQNPYVEGFLLRLLDNYLEKPNPFEKTKNYHNLLWQYFLRNNRFLPAATILNRLAETRGNAITIHERVEYLSRARSCLSESTGVDGETVHKLQERYEVAQIQLKIFDQVNDENVKSELNVELLSISDLYNKYAKKYKLWECQLAILHCSGYNDPALVRRIWDNIIHGELSDNKLEPLREKVLMIGREYFPSELVFPLTFITDFLERTSFDNRDSSDWTVTWVVDTLHEVGISYGNLFDLYNFLFDTKDSFWQPSVAQLHLLTAIYGLLLKWTNFVKSNSATVFDRRQLESKSATNAVDKFVTALQTSRDSASLDLVVHMKELRKDLATLMKRDILF